MCQRLYVATRTPLKTVKRTKQAPYLELQLLGKAAGAIRGRFLPEEFPHMCVAGAYSPCGCGFPEEHPARKGKCSLRPSLEPLLTECRHLARAPDSKPPHKARWVAANLRWQPKTAEAAIRARDGMQPSGGCSRSRVPTGRHECPPNSTT